jgi:hypothetical protein
LGFWIGVEVRVSVRVVIRLGLYSDNLLNNEYGNRSEVSTYCDRKESSYDKERSVIIVAVISDILLSPTLDLGLGLDLRLKSGLRLDWV